MAGLTAVLVAADASADEQPVFRSSVARIGPVMAARMTSWHRGCPVAISDLRLVTVSYWGFDRRIHQGRLVVARGSARAVVRGLHAVFTARFPIHRMEPVEAYRADDDRSMAADNTSVFNCRHVEGSRSWSEHAYGRAIDVNPLENPELLGRRVLPPAGARYADRSRRAKGMIHAGDPVVHAFAAVGWRWGGYWRAPKDYQHFSSTGR